MPVDISMFEAAAPGFHQLEAGAGTRRRRSPRTWPARIELRPWSEQDQRHLPISARQLEAERLVAGQAAMVIEVGDQLLDENGQPRTGGRTDHGRIGEGARGRDGIVNGREARKAEL